MRFTLSKDFRFEASHQLHAHDGKCARLHGHSWVGRVVVAGPDLVTEGPKTGMLLDYADLKAAVQPLLDQYLDHWHLNDTLALAAPTSEAVACWLYERLRAVLPTLVAVEIEETCTSRCRYEP